MHGIGADLAVNEELLRAVRFFTQETGIMDGFCAMAGKDDRTIFAEDGRDIGDRTLYDLASVTKLFTGLCLARLWEEGSLDPTMRIARGEPRFEKLTTVTVEQLAGFQVTVRTPGRIDGQGDRESALRCLFASEAVNMGSGASTHYTPGHRIQRVYSDIPAMVLKYIIENVVQGFMLQGQIQGMFNGLGFMCQAAFEDFEEKTGA